MNTSAALTIAGEYTADQWGMITAAQATAAGIDSVTLHRLADVGHLEPVRRGVYAATIAPASPHRDVQAAWLALNPAVPAWERPKLDPDGGVISHRTAALLHELGDMVTDNIEMTVPRRRVTRDPVVRLRQRDLDEDDVVLVDGLPVTSAERTIEDLLADRVDASHVAAVIKDAAQAHQLDLDHLASRIGRHCRRYGVKSQDGNNLIDHLLGQIGTSRAKTHVAEIAAASSPIPLQDAPRDRRSVRRAPTRSDAAQVVQAFEAQLAPLRKELAQISAKLRDFDSREDASERDGTTRKPEDVADHTEDDE